MSEFTKFVEKELKRLERAGLTVKRVRATDSWISFHIMDKETYVHSSIDVVNRPKSAPNEIGISMKSLYGKNRSYWYDSDEKFQKGFKRNVINRHLSFKKPSKRMRTI